jgi:hypothetical protein
MAHQAPEPAGDALAAELATFLETGLVSEDAAALVAEGRALSQRILAELLHTVGDDDPNESAAERAISPVAKAIAVNFVARPEQWSEILKLAELYLGRAYTSEGHPLREPHTVQLPGEKKVRYQVRTRLPAALLRSLLATAKNEERLAFARTVDGPALQPLEEVLPHLELSIDVAIELIRQIDQVTSGPHIHLSRGALMEALKEWASKTPASAQAAQAIVERWMAGRVQLAWPMIQLLVEAAVESPAEMAIDASKWRDRVLDSLLAESGDDQLKLAMNVAAFAHPEPRPSVAIRLAKSLELLKRKPGQLWRCAMDLAHREAHRYPTEALDFSLRALALLSPDDAPPGEAAIWVARVARAGLYSSADGKAASPPRRDLLEMAVNGFESLTIDLEHPAPMEFDMFLAELFKCAPNLVETTLARWLSTSGYTLVSEDSRSLSDLFPFLGSQLDRDATDLRWLTRWMVDTDGELRQGATLLFSRSSGGGQLDGSAVMALTTRQVEGLAHQLAGSGVHGECWIGALFDLGLARPDALEEITEILVADGATDYPQLCLQYLEVWNHRSSGEDPARQDALISAQARLRQALETTRKATALKAGVREVTAIRPAARHWVRIHERAMQVVFSRASGRAALLSHFAKVPVACGEASVHGEAPPVPFGEVATTISLPVVETIDPITAVLRRLGHQKEAAALLSRREAETGTP